MTPPFRINMNRLAASSGLLVVLELLHAVTR